MRQLLLGLALMMVFAGLPAIADTTGLVPCGGEGDPECQACHVVQLAQNILTWVINIMASIIALVFVIGGIKMVMSAGDTGAVKQARKMITNSVIGFIILLTAWLIMDTVLKTFVNEGALKEGGMGPWHQIECVPPPTYLAGTVTPPVGAGPGTGLAPGAERMTDTSAREMLSAAGIPVNAQEPQTSLEGMNVATVQDAINLKNACGCDIIITGGTEDGHSTTGTMNHSTGFKYDIGLNPQVTDYIKTNYLPVGVRTDGAAQYKNTTTGTVYALEGNHWDVVVGGT